MTNVRQFAAYRVNGMTDTAQPPGDLPDAPRAGQGCAGTSAVDLAYLQQHPLIQSPASRDAEIHLSRRSGCVLIADAIEALNPGKGAPFRYPHARVYNMLTLHYGTG